MIGGLREILGTISGYKQKYEQCLYDCEDWRDDLKLCYSGLTKARDKIKRLELVTERPQPPEITYIRERYSAWIQQVLDSLGVGIIRLPLDVKYRLTNETNFLNIVAWDWVDSVKYESEVFDCENFAIAFKSHVDRYFGLNQVGIVIDYKSGHAYNLVIYPDGNVSVLEPQQDAIYVWAQRPEIFYSLTGAIVLI